MALSCKFYHPVGLAPSSTVSGRCEDDEEGQDNILRISFPWYTLKESRIQGERDKLV